VSFVVKGLFYSPATSSAEIGKHPPTEARCCAKPGRNSSKPARLDIRESNFGGWVDEMAELVRHAEPHLGLLLSRRAENITANKPAAGKNR